MPVIDKVVPEATETIIEMPDHTERKKAAPKPKKLNKAMPTSGHPENRITIKDETIELYPTKLKYFRNRTASVYKILKLIPLNEFLAYDKGVFDEERDSDQILFDFLVAVFDDSKIVTKYYDDMTAEHIEIILEIFGRLNHIDEKEEANQKNMQAQVNR